MNFRPSITPIEVTKKGAFGETYFRDIYSSVTDKWYKNSWKEFSVLKSIIAQIIMMLVLINMVSSVEHH